MDDRAIDALRELTRYETELAASVKQLHSVISDVGTLRTRPEQIDAFCAAYSDTETRARAGVGRSDRALETRRCELADAHAALDNARANEGRAAAERALARTVDRVRAGEARVERATAEHERLQHVSAAVSDELSQLEIHATAITQELQKIDEPRSGANGLVEWATRTRASLLVGAAQIDMQPRASDPRSKRVGNDRSGRADVRIDRADPQACRSGVSVTASQPVKQFVRTHG